MHTEDAGAIHPSFYSARVQRIVMIKPLIAGINWLWRTFSAGGGRSPLMLRAELSLAVCWKQVWRRLLGWHHCLREWGLIQWKHLFHALSVWDFCLIVHHRQKRLLPFINGCSTSCSAQRQSRTQRRGVYSSRSYYHSGGGVALSRECAKVSELFVRVYYVCFWGGGRGHRDIWSASFMALLEVKFLESEVSLHDASGLDASSQHVLLGGDVICFGYPFQIIQVTERRQRDVLNPTINYHVWINCST